MWNNQTHGSSGTLTSVNISEKGKYFLLANKEKHVMSGMVTFTFLVGINDPENCIVDIEVQNSRADPLWSTRGHSGTPLPHSTFLMQQSSPVSEADTTYDFDLNLLQSCIERHRGAVKLEIGVVQSSRGIFREQGSSVLCGQDSWETLAGQGHE